MNRIGMILLGSFLVLSLIFLFVFPSSREFIIDLYTQQGQESLKHFIYSLGIWGPIVSIFLMVLHSIIFIPSEVILFANIYLFGFYIGLFYTWVGSMLGAYVSFYLARFYGRPFVERFLPKEKVQNFDQWLENKGIFGFFILRLIPLFSFNLLNYGAGLTKMNVWQFTWSTGIGILPPSIILAWLSVNAMKSSWGIVVLLVLAMIIFLIKLFKNKRKN